MAILVTGGTGFLGKHVVSYFQKIHKNVVVAYRHTLPDITEGLTCVQVDLADRNQVKTLFLKYKIDSVIHLAMQMRGNIIADYIRNSILATQNLVQEAEVAGIQTFVLASSIAVYGIVNGIVDESSYRVNLDDYGTSKFLCERMLEDSEIRNRLSIRLPRMLGDKMDLSYPWIPALIGKLIRGDKVLYFNPQLPYNNMAHVSTLTDFLGLQLQKNEQGYKMCTLGASEPLSVLEIISRLRSGLSSSSELLEKKDNIPPSTCYHIDISNACRMGYKALSVSDTLDMIVNDIRKEYGVDDC